MAHSFTRKIGLPGVLSSQSVKARRDLRDKRFLSTTIFVFSIIIGLLFVYVWCRVTVVSTGYEMSRANARRNVLLEQNRRLRIEFMKLKAPERIESIATGRLGLVRPSGKQIIRVR